MIHITEAESNNDGVLCTIIAGQKSGGKPVCMECSSPSNMLHACGHCQTCCMCIPCSKCMVVQVSQYCNLCNACDACCTCTVCLSCGLVTNGKLCDVCRGCSNCCNRRHNGIIFVQASVDLERYVPTDKQLTMNGSPRLLSAEVETCGYSSEKVSALNSMLTKWNCSVVHDGSLPDRGFEINTHPAGGDLWMQMCTELYQSMTMAKVSFNSSAGCHIHVDARDLGYIQIANLLRMYYYAELGMYRLIAKERRENRFCAPCGLGYMTAITRVKQAANQAPDDTTRALIYRQAVMNELYKNKANLNKAVPKSFVASMRRSKGNGPRYRGLNLHSWIYRGTIEFRFPGHQPSALDLQMLGCMLANFLDLAKRSEAQVASLTKDVEKEFTTKGPNGVSSLAFLRSLSPTPQVDDWITERAKFYNNLSTAFATQL